MPRFRLPRAPRIPHALRNRTFVLLWLSRSIAQAGAAITFVVLPLAVFDLTGSASALAMSLGGQTLTVIVLSSFGGSLADRVSRRGLIVAGDLTRAVVLLGLLFVHSRDQLWVAFTCAAAATAAATLMKPAYAAIVNDVVSPDALQQSNALNGVVGSITGAVAPVLGVAAYAAFGLQGVVLATAASLVVAAALMLGVSAPARGRSTVPAKTTRLRGVRDDLTLAARAAWRRPMLRGLLVGSGLGGFGHGALLVCMVPFLRGELDLSARAYGTALAAMSIAGLLANGVVAARLSNVDSLRLYRHGLPLVGPVLVAAAAACHQPLLAVALFALHGAAPVLSDVAGSTLLMRHTPLDMTGRMFALGELVSHVFLLGGTLLAGVVADSRGTTAALLLAGAAYVAWGAVGLLMSRGGYERLGHPVLPAAAPVGTASPAAPTPAAAPVAA